MILNNFPKSSMSLPTHHSPGLPILWVYCKNSEHSAQGHTGLYMVLSCTSSLGNLGPSCIKKKKSRFHVCACPDPDLSLFPPTVPSDVFFINSVWKGYYEYLGKRQPATLTVDWFNATSSKVNATFTAASQVQLELTGRKEDLQAHFLTKVVWALPTWNVIGVLSDCGLCLLVFLSGDYGEWYRNETPSFFFPQNCMYDLLN